MKAITFIVYATLTYAQYESPMTCENVKCDFGKSCKLVPVQCIRAPCFPIPQCVADESASSKTCENMQCDEGTECKQVDVQCLMAPCPPLSLCVPKRNQTSCAAMQCHKRSSCEIVDGEAKCVPHKGPLSCSSFDCIPGKYCKMQGGIPHCVGGPDSDLPTNPCAFTTCPVGSACRTKSITCYDPPCIPIAECFTPAKDDSCGQNEHRAECSTRCEPSCTNKTPICPLVCDPPKCQCSGGFFRNASGSCVTENQCDSGTQS